MRYFGGKWRLAPWVIETFPAHDCYVEPFAGAGSVLLRKEPSTFEYLNDLDGEVVNLFRVLRDDREELVQRIQLTPFSRKELRDAYEPSNEAIERARRLYIRAWQARGGPRAQWRTGWRFQRSAAARGKSALGDWRDVGHLQAIADRLLGVSLEQDDALAVVKRYDSPNTLHYVDPPYLASTRNRRWQDKAYECEFSTDAEHEDLLQVLNGLQGMVVLSGYPSDLYRQLVTEEGWVMRTRSARTDVGEAVEALWLNPALIARSSQASIPFEAVS